MEAYVRYSGIQGPSKYKGQHAQIQGEVITVEAFPGNSPSPEGLNYRRHGGGEEQKQLKRLYGYNLCAFGSCSGPWPLSCQVAILV